MKRVTILKKGKGCNLSSQLNCTNFKEHFKDDTKMIVSAQNELKTYPYEGSMLREMQVK